MSDGRQLEVNVNKYTARVWVDGHCAILTGEGFDHLKHRAERLWVSFGGVKTAQLFAPDGTHRFSFNGAFWTGAGR